MTPKQFCIWLDGYFSLIDGMPEASDSLNYAQIATLRAHLAAALERSDPVPPPFKAPPKPESILEKLTNGY
jgi:hypothetical protein